MKKILLSLSLLSASFGMNAQSWTPQATGFEAASRGINEISIVDANTVWALAYDGTTAAEVVQEFTRTTNGGTTWTPGFINISNDEWNINNISAIDANTAWVSAIDLGTGLGGVYKTTDGGATWAQKNAAAYTTLNETFLNGVHFFNANNGVSYGDPVGGVLEIYTTSDGGENWTAVIPANIPALLPNEYGYNGGNVFIGNTAYIVTNKGRIFRSADMGINWTVSQTPVGDFSATTQSGRLSFSTPTNGCMLKTQGTAYTFYTTTDGGATWSAGTPFTGLYRLLTYVPGTTTIVATSQATNESGSAFSNDNGVTWTAIDAGEQRGVSSFLNGSTGWSAGFSQNATTGGIFKFDGVLSNAGFNATKFSVYPNPSSSLVTISSVEFDSYKLKVTDITGKVMINKEFNGLVNAVDVSNFSNGIYFFEVNAGNKIETIKIIKN